MANHVFDPVTKWMCIGSEKIGPHLYCRVCACCNEPSCKHYTSHDVDAVNHPPHYNSGSIECIDAIKAALTPEEFRGYCKGNAFKYIWRENHKDKAQDLKKARFYLERLIDGTDK